MRHNWAINNDITGANHIRSHTSSHWYGHRVETHPHSVKNRARQVSVLQDKNILVTSSGNTAERLADMLEQAGAQATIMPVIEIADPDCWQALDDAIEHLDSYQWLFFASGNAVISFCKRWQYVYGGISPGEIFKLEKQVPKIAVIGKATASVANQNGLPVHYCPQNYLAEDFVAQFPDYPHLQGQHILWPRTDVGRDIIIDQLQNAGARIKVVPAYRTILPRNTAELCLRLNELVAGRQLDVVALASYQTAINLSKIISLILEQNRQHKLLPPADYQTVLQSYSTELASEDLKQIAHFLEPILLVTIGPQTAVGALNYLGKESLQADPHTNEGMLAALIEYYQTK
jgi:uroporphyrinogen-III synthase